MRELHVVAVSDDGRHVVLAQRRGSSKGAFKVAIDASLHAAIRGELPRSGDEVVPELSPKEIQARLRAGESAEKIAQSAGVPVARVQRYAGPVEGEMARMIDGARSAYLVRGRLGRSAHDLGTAVDAALVHGGADEGAGEWSTYRREDGTWLVTVRWYARKRSRSASWAYDPATKLVTASDPSSAALAHTESEDAVPRRRAAAAPVKKAAPAKKAAAKKAPAKRAVAKKAPAKKAVAKKAVAKKAPTKKPVAKKAPATKASPAKKAPARPVKTAAVTKAIPARTAPARRGGLRVVPDPEPRPVTKGKAKGGSATSRASVPAWADVLLGTTPGSER